MKHSNCKFSYGFLWVWTLLETIWIMLGYIYTKYVIQYLNVERLHIKPF